MLKRLELNYFRQHTELAIDFAPGINAIRGANEAGKTTILQAIAYALFGTKGLPESLDDVVTYGEPVSKLKVSLAFEYSGVIYVINRSKSGAELNAPSLRVTGQTETTKFIERLFGCNADMAGKLMIAEQSNLRGTLSEGPTAAGKMIEDLADFDLLDRIIELVQTELVAGSTSGVEGQIAMLEKQAAEVVMEDLSELQLQVTAAGEKVVKAKASVDEMKSLVDGLDPVKARATIQQHSNDTTLLAGIQPKLEAAQAFLAMPAAVAPDDAEIERLRKAKAEEAQIRAALALRAELEKLDTSELWDNTLESLQAEIAKTNQEEKDAVKAAQILAHEKLVLEGKVVKGESCTFCGKDLKDIPEVVKVNNALWPQIVALSEQIVQHEEEATTARTYLGQLEQVVTVNSRIQRVYDRASAYIKLDTARVPAAWEWTGPAPLGDREEINEQLKGLEAAQKAYNEDVATRKAKAEYVENLTKEIAEVRESLARLDLQAAQDHLKQWEQRTTDLAAYTQIYHTLLADLQGLQSDLRAKEATAEQQKKQQAQAAEQLTAARATLEEMQANNALVKKLRWARPQITDKLWNIVLAAVSSYLTDVRGVKSIVTRADAGFKINGNPVAGLSGSAKDALGLAIRLALTRTFLPNSSFLILDEMAAACDDQRELAMLGLLSTVGFAQTVLVTHSEHCDAFADNIIRI